MPSVDGAQAHCSSTSSPERWRSREAVTCNRALVSILLWASCCLPACSFMYRPRAGLTWDPSCLVFRNTT
jgi:hypothetical protein